MIYFFNSTNKADKLRHPIIVSTNGSERPAYILAVYNFRKNNMYGSPKRVMCE